MLRGSEYSLGPLNGFLMGVALHSIVAFGTGIGAELTVLNADNSYNPNQPCQVATLNIFVFTVNARKKLASGI